MNNEMLSSKIAMWDLVVPAQAAPILIFEDFSIPAVMDDVSGRPGVITTVMPGVPLSRIVIGDDDRVRVASESIRPGGKYRCTLEYSCT
jgi:hypothetical protein